MPDPTFSVRVTVAAMVRATNRSWVCQYSRSETAPSAAPSAPSAPGRGKLRPPPVGCYLRAIARWSPMRTHLSVGVETNCTAPLGLERATMRLCQLFGVDSLFLPDHYLSFVPRSVWGPELTPAAKLVPSPDAFFDPYVMLGMMAARYRRVRLGTGVTEPFRRHPATLAQAFVTLDHLTGVAGWVADYHRLAATTDPATWVTTHGEPHERNLLVGPDGPLLVDWETVLLAPRERDLRPCGLPGDPDLLRMFDLEWRLDEISQYAAWFEQPHGDGEDDRVSLGGLRHELTRPDAATTERTV
jgi:hypothetical protein